MTALNSILSASDPFALSVVASVGIAALAAFYGLL